MKIKIQFVLTMLLFGSIGLFTKNLTIPSASIVQWRAIIGFAFLVLFFFFTRRKVDTKAVKSNLIPLLISGVLLGCNWAFLFEGFKTTSVGMATIIYYFAPIIVFFLAPIIFKEKLSKFQIIGISSAVIGMVLVNLQGFMGLSFSNGVIYSFIAAVLYASIMICNKFIHNISGFDSTLLQLFIAIVVMTIYCYASSGSWIYIPTAQDTLSVIILGVVHTGIAYSVYFYAIQKLSPQITAVCSYIDPASALIFAFIFLGENLAIYQIIGAVLIFGGSLFAQLRSNHK